jgi:hypothetical protein
MPGQYDPPAPGVEAANMLSKYNIGLHAAESRDRLDVNLDAEPSAVSHVDVRRFVNVVVVWTVVVLAVAGAGTWFLDRVLAAETVTVLTAIVMVTGLARLRRTAA